MMLRSIKIVVSGGCISSASWIQSFVVNIFVDWSIQMRITSSSHSPNGAEKDRLLINEERKIAVKCCHHYWVGREQRKTTQCDKATTMAAITETIEAGTVKKKITSDCLEAFWNAKVNCSNILHHRYILRFPLSLLRCFKNKDRESETRKNGWLWKILWTFSSSSRWKKKEK